MVQSDDNTVCLDCSSPLGSSMSEGENKVAEASIKDKVNDMAERTDEFYISLRDKIMGYVCIGFIVVALVLIALAYHQYQQLNPNEVSQITINDHTVTLPNGFDVPTPRMYQLKDVMNLGWICILVSAFTCPLLLAPRFVWWLKTWKYRFYHGWETPPSYYDTVSRKIVAGISFVISAIALIYGWILFF
jgi:hypothetical protein